MSNNKDIKELNNINNNSNGDQKNSITKSTPSSSNNNNNNNYVSSYHFIEEYLKNWVHEVAIKWQERLQQIRDILKKYSEPSLMMDIPLSIDELDEESLYPHNTVSSDRFLNTYSMEEVKEYLNRFKVLELLDKRGYKNTKIQPDFSDSFVHRIKVTDDSLAELKGADQLLIDCFVRRKEIYLSDIEADQKNGGSSVAGLSSQVQNNLPRSPYGGGGGGGGQVPSGDETYTWKVDDTIDSLLIVSSLINFPIKASVIEWLALQDPLKEFSNSRPPLPGQQHPGLGIAKEMDKLFVYMATKSLRDCLLNTPYRFYNAFMYQAGEYFFIDPKQQSFFLSLLNDLEPAIKQFGLAPVSWAFEFGCVKERQTQLPVKWEFHKQARPTSQRMKNYFTSPQYVQYCARNTKTGLFYIDWKGSPSLAHFSSPTPSPIQSSSTPTQTTK